MNSTLARRLAAVADRPAALAALLLAYGLVVHPYRGLYHDAILYGLQTLNRATGGQFAGDLFFRFGSQDKFSVFSPLVAPVAGVAGLPATFLIGYLLSAGLCLFATARLCRRVCPDPLSAVAAAVFVGVVPITFSGLGVLHVVEPFFTPRLPAVALVLLGLERLLAGRPGQAATAVLAAMPVHPLMAVSGLAVVAGWVAVERLPRRVLGGLATAGVLVGAGLLAWEPAGLAVFGRMDPAWMAEVRAVNSYAFPDEWSAADWSRIGIRGLAVGLAAVLLPGPRRRRLAALVGLVAAAGLVIAVIAPYRPYALLLQGQAYRALWPLEWLAFPFAFALAGGWWASGRPDRRLAAVGLVASLIAPNLLDELSRPFLLAVPVALLAVRGKRPDWLATGLAAGLAVAVVGRSLTGYLVFARMWPELTSEMSALTAARVVPLVSEPAVRLAVGVLLAAAWAAVGWQVRGVAVLAAVGLTVGVVTTDRGSDDDQAGVEFAVRAVGADHPGGPPSVYWPNGHVQRVWFDLHACNYFEWPHQLAGNAFSREQAMEARRRAGLAAPFERDKWSRRSAFLTAYVRRVIVPLFGDPGVPADPTAANLARLAADPALDYAIVRLRVDGWFTATDGTWYVYDCRRLRADGRLAPEQCEPSTTRLGELERFPTRYTNSGAALAQP